MYQINVFCIMIISEKKWEANSTYALGYTTWQYQIEQNIELLCLS